MLGNTIGWVFVALCATPGAGREAMSHGPRGGTILTGGFRQVLDAAPRRSHRVWVFFTDKNIRSTVEYQAALAARSTQLSDRTLRRRALRRTAPGLLDHRDLAPAGDYVRAVCSTGARLRHQSRWLNAVSVEAAAAEIHAIARLPFVRRIEPLARSVIRPPRPAVPVDGDGSPRDGDEAWYGASYDQLAQINVVAAHKAGYTGSGIIVGILDTGFKRTHDAFNQTEPPAHPVQIIDEYDFINDDDNTAPEPGDPENQHSHGTLILGTLGAYYPTVLVGAAFDAAFLLAKTEDITQEIPEEEDQYVAGLEWIEANGGDMATSSLGYIDWYDPEDLDGQTAVTTIAVNVATANGLVCCTAAGNGGHDDDPATLHLLAPADAFQVLACGAVRANGNIAGFSSDGPSYDGRAKPEVLARGLHTRTVDPYDDTNIVEASGTSLSTPLVAGATALLLQAHPDWTVDEIRRALMHTASDFMENALYDPLYIRGYGIINVVAAIEFVHGDVDGDGLADGRDIAPFVASLLGGNDDLDENRRADMNADGIIDINDVAIFVNDLLAP